ncbi:MAG: GNAT family N-acetyltransferase [Thermaerobacter sp.]|nr:GNAT family N-acetyltransferase [Thermaerobacter sp.]
MNPVVIRSMNSEDWPDVGRIYQEGIATGQATFEQEVPSRRIWDANHLGVCRLVADSKGVTVGWAALSPTSARRVYAGVAEVSIYVSQSHVGLGVGTQLLQFLIRASDNCGIWTLQAVIFPENIPSVKLHSKLGFRLVGRRERIGRMNGVWRDTVLMERRSPVIS